MDIKVFPKPLGGQLNVISSKSLSHRYVIAAGLAHGVSHLENVLESDDLKATKKALESLNVLIDGDQISGGNLKVITPVIDCFASGSTVRFLIPIALTLDHLITFIGRDRLPERPLDIYETLFKSLGLYYQRTSDQHLPIEVKGPLQATTFQVPGNVSSQFITGLLFATPLLNKDSVIKIIGPLESEGYVDLTLDVLKQFGIVVQRQDNQFLIKGNQTYQPQNLHVEGDYSQAAFFMVAGLIGQPMKLYQLNSNSHQGDRAIIDIIKAMQGDITHDRDAYHINPSKTFGTQIDLSHIPDLGPILMILAALSHGQTTFINGSRLRLKESDRLQVMVDILKQFKVPFDLSGDTLKIEGVENFEGNQTFDTHGDHRIAMALMIASSRVNGPIIIKDIDVINKSYPAFLEDFKHLGGSYEKLS